MKIIKIIKESRADIIVFVVLIILGVVSRMVPHLANFTAVGAISLFAGFYFKKQWKILAPLAIMFISDSVLGFYDLKLMFTVYFCLFVYFILGSYIKQNKVVFRAISFSLLGSTSFFIITNFAVWSLAGWYPHTGAGLSNCYIMALPFFFNSLMGDVFYTSVIFGAYAFVLNYSRLNNAITVNSK